MVVQLDAKLPVYFPQLSFNPTAKLNTGLVPAVVHAIRHKVPMPLKLKLLVRQRIGQ
jgi:hypothetical protein